MLKRTGNPHDKCLNQNKIGKKSKITYSLEKAEEFH